MSILFTKLLCTLLKSVNTCSSDGALDGILVALLGQFVVVVAAVIWLRFVSFRAS